MDDELFRDALSELSLSQAKVARLLGTDERTARRWALGESAVPTSVGILLTLWMENPKLLERCWQLCEEREAAEAKAAKKASRR